MSDFLSVVSFPSDPPFAVYTAYGFTVSREECWRVVLFYSEGAKSSLIVKPLLLAEVCLAAVLKGGQVAWARGRLLPTVT